MQPKYNCFSVCLRRQFPFLRGYKGCRGFTAFLAAISTGSASLVEFFIKNEADVNLAPLRNVKPMPLQKAAEIGSLIITEILLDHGASINAAAVERSSSTALQLAAIEGYIPIACKLLNLRADVNAPASKVNGRTALEGATDHGRLDMVRLLLSEGAGLKGKDMRKFPTSYRNGQGQWI